MLEPTGARIERKISSFCGFGVDGLTFDGELALECFVNDAAVLLFRASKIPVQRVQEPGEERQWIALFR